MGKVIEMPDPLERRAQKIEAALDRIRLARSNYFDATLDLICSMQDAPPPIIFSTSEVRMAKQMLTDITWTCTVVSKLKQSNSLDRPTIREIFKAWKAVK